jgi:hypothetical protein
VTATPRAATGPDGRDAAYEGLHALAVVHVRAGDAQGLSTSRHVSSNATCLWQKVLWSYGLLAIDRGARSGRIPARGAKELARNANAFDRRGRNDVSSLSARWTTVKGNLT